MKFCARNEAVVGLGGGRQSDRKEGKDRGVRGKAKGGVAAGKGFGILGKEENPQEIGKCFLSFMSDLSFFLYDRVPINICVFSFKFFDFFLNLPVLSEVIDRC